MRTAMIGTGRIDRILPRWLALGIVVCALLARIVVPQGWMPTQTADGWQIMLCSGSGPMTVAMPEAIASALDHDGKQHQDGHQPSDHPCGFTGVAAALDGPRAIAVVLPALVATVWRPATVFAVSIGRGLSAPPPPSTGPPPIL